MRSPPHSRDHWWAPGTDTGFRQRCASTLTHPVTVVALATLLLNDLLFKAMWPDAWVTGKLSDLAWVVFALPLLAFLLSLFTRGSVMAARVAFLTSYVGLPLLYAAFNTFEPVHYWILRGISLASGGMGRTPLDATDSIVIPLGWAVATWVWRRPALSPDALRMRLGLLVAAVAVLASLATSYPEPDYGITRVGSQAREEGFAVVASDSTGTLYRSDDGGFTWKTDRSIDGSAVFWGSESAETSGGIYHIDRAEVLLSGYNGQEEVVYSTSYLSQSGNLWAQKRSTGHLDIRIMATRPLQLVLDEDSGNLIVAMGIQGVLVGTPEEGWMPRPVGRYNPTDFTILGKSGLLLSDLSFWITALSLSLSMTAAGLILRQQSRGLFWALLSAALAIPGIVLLWLGSQYLFIFFGIEFAIFAVVMNAIGLALLFLAGLSAGIGRKPLAIATTALVVLVLGSLFVNVLPHGTILIPVFILAGVVGYSIWGRNSRAAWTLALTSVIISLPASGVLLIVFGGSDPADYDQLTYQIVSTAALVVALTIGIASFLISLRLRYWRASTLSLVGMTVLIILAFTLWLHLGIPLVLAKVAAFVLTILVSYRLASYAKLRSREQPSIDDPQAPLA